MPLLSTLDALTLLQTKLAALKWTDDSNLFDAVKIYSSTDLFLALQEMRVFKDRACFLIASDDVFDNVITGREMQTAVTRSVIALMTDRNYGFREKAQTGDADKTVGVLRMKDTVIAAIAGNNLGERQVLVRPTGGNALILTDQKQRDNVAGREAWSLELAIDCGSFLTKH